MHACEIRFSHDRSETQQNDSIPMKPANLMDSTVVSERGPKWVSSMNSMGGGSKGPLQGMTIGENHKQ